MLIADSDTTLRQRLFSALLQLDIFSDCVGTTADAQEKLAAEKYGVLVLDVALPPGNTDSVIMTIAQMPKEARPVVLVLAANPEAARGLDV
ncbi:MAG: hypothetical protein ACLGH0_00320, partial [Thermoanaerobaculia bacterium]